MTNFENPLSKEEIQNAISMIKQTSKNVYGGWGMQVNHIYISVMEKYYIVNEEYFVSHEGHSGVFFKWKDVYSFRIVPMTEVKSIYSAVKSTKEWGGTYGKI